MTEFILYTWDGSTRTESTFRFYHSARKAFLTAIANNVKYAELRKAEYLSATTMQITRIESFNKEVL